MKKYVDSFRGKLPPPLEKCLPGVLLSDLDQINKWRYWGTGPTYIDDKNGITLIGALDDCLVDGDVYIPLDWKTKGSKPKDDGSQYYQTQLDCYNLMVGAQGVKVRDEGYLVYIYPANARTLKNHDQDIPISNIVGIEFCMVTYKLNCNAERARELVIKAAELLRGPRPKASPRCEHCRYIEILKTIPEG